MGGKPVYSSGAMRPHEESRRFEELMMPHLDAAYNLALWLTRDPQDAQDVVQEAYARALRFFDGFRGEESRAWLLAIVRNTCFNWMKRNRTGAANIEDAAAANDPALTDKDTPERAMLEATSRERLNRAIAELPEEFREALVLRELEDMSYKEIAQVAGIPIGTVMSRLARARELLRKALIDPSKREAEHGL